MTLKLDYYCYLIFNLLRFYRFGSLDICFIEKYFLSFFLMQLSYLQKYSSCILR